MTSIALHNGILYADRCTVDHRGYKDETKIFIARGKRLAYATSGRCVRSEADVTKLERLMVRGYAETVSHGTGKKYATADTRPALKELVEYLRSVADVHRTLWLVGTMGLASISLRSDKSVIDVNYTDDSLTGSHWAGTGGEYLLGLLQHIPDDLDRVFRILASIDYQSNYRYDTIDISKLKPTILE